MRGDSPCYRTALLLHVDVFWRHDCSIHIYLLQQIPKKSLQLDFAQLARCKTSQIALLSEQVEYYQVRTCDISAMRHRLPEREVELPGLAPLSPVLSSRLALRSTASRVSRALAEARRARSHSMRSLSAHSLVAALRHDLTETRAEVSEFLTETKAEVSEFITSPHLLFQPLRLAFVVALPLLYPLTFIPLKHLFLYGLCLVTWYLLCVCYFATEVAMRPPWYKRGLPMIDLPPYWKGIVHDPKKDLNLDFENVEFRNPISGLMLRGWFIAAAADSSSSSSLRVSHSFDDKAASSIQFDSLSNSSSFSNTPAVVFVHGAGRDRRTFMRHAAVFNAAGMHTLLFDTSEHGLSDSADSRSSGRGTSFGAREQHDVIAAVRYLRHKRGINDIALVGTSAGAASAILAAAADPKLVSCVVAENPFSRADYLLIHHCDSALENYLSQNSRRKVRALVFWVASRVLLFRMGQYFRGYGPIDAVENLTCPLLVAHSTADDVVPFSHGRAVYERAVAAKKHMPGMVKFFEMKDAAHCALFDKSPEEWIDVVLPFVLSGLASKNTFVGK